jgi:hypothetical protein
MKKVFILIFVGLLSCDFKNKNNESLTIDDIDSTILYVDTTTVLGEHYKAIFRTDNVLYVTKSNGDTILKESDLFQNFEFKDFNNDGHNDLMISYISNNPIQDLFLFDTDKMDFKKVKDFSNYLESKPITGTKYYYSYHRSGCADMNWDSDLFYLDQFSTICIGNISGRQCDGDKFGIYINLIDGDSKRLIEVLPIETIESYPDTKWGLIKEYWTRNYNKFEKGQ